MRTNPRTTAARVSKKKSPIPAVAVLVYMAVLAMCYVIVQIDNRQLSYTLENNKKEVSESRNRIRNLDAEVETRTAKPFIEKKIIQFNLGLRLPEQIIKQVYEVTHFDNSKGALSPQTLKEEDNINTLTKK